MDILAHTSYKEGKVSIALRSGCCPAAPASLRYGLGNCGLALFEQGLLLGDVPRRVATFRCLILLLRSSWKVSWFHKVFAYDPKKDGWFSICAERDPAMLFGLGHVREGDRFLQHSLRSEHGLTPATKVFSRFFDSCEKCKDNTLQDRFLSVKLYQELAVQVRN